MADPMRIRAQVAGDKATVRVLMAHEMESGQRKDSAGKLIPRQIINKFTAEFNGKMVFEADWFTAISANPYQSFFYKADESGEFKFSWKDDNGSTYSSTAKLTVA